MFITFVGLMFVLLISLHAFTPLNGHCYKTLIFLMSQIVLPWNLYYKTLQIRLLQKMY